MPHDRQRILGEGQNFSQSFFKKKKIDSSQMQSWDILNTVFFVFFFNLKHHDLYLTGKEIVKV